MKSLVAIYHKAKRVFRENQQDHVVYINADEEYQGKKQIQCSQYWMTRGV